MDAAPLDYARRRRRRVPRAWIVIGLIAVATFAAPHYGGPAWRCLSLAYHVREARAAFAACQQVAMPGGVARYVDRGSTPRRAPDHVHRVGYAGYHPPLPDVPPRVAKPPPVWVDLGRHVRAAASLDRTSGTFAASAAAGLPEVMLQPDEAVLFVGNPQGPPAASPRTASNGWPRSSTSPASSLAFDP